MVAWHAFDSITVTTALRRQLQMDSGQMTSVAAAAAVVAEVMPMSWPTGPPAAVRAHQMAAVPYHVRASHCTRCLYFP